MDDPDTSQPAAAQRVGVVFVVLVAVASVTAAAMFMGPVRSLGLPSISDTVSPADIADLVLALVLTGLGGLVVLRTRARTYGWLMLAAGAFVSVTQLGEEYGVLAHYGEVDRPLQAVGYVAADVWILWFAIVVLLLPAVFPDGRSVGRWRRPVRGLTWVWGAVIVLFFLIERPVEGVFQELPDPPANPLGVLPLPLDIVNFGWGLATIASLVVAVGSLITRWRTADRDVRQQLKMVLYAFGLSAFAMAALIIDTILVEVMGTDLGLAPVVGIAISVSWTGLAVALGFGVLRYRIYDIDLVINRTLVYTVMTVTVVLAYIAVVVGVGSLVAETASLGLSLLATAVVAVGFNPVRTRVQRGVNRLMFGRRDDPYALLSELGHLLARSGAAESTLTSVVETVRMTLKLPGVTVEVDRGDGWDQLAAAGEIGEHVEVIELRHQGQVVGRMVVARRSPAEPLHDEDLRLLEDIAHQAAAVTHGIRLTLALQHSREQLVVAREEERRRLRRDLHDGLGPSLASQTFRLDAVLELLDHDPAAARPVVSALKEQTQELVADIRRLVYELRPPALDELGLVGALSAHAGQLARTRDLTVRVTTVPNPFGELPAAVEVAAYHIVREAITNVIRHAQASRCEVALERRHPDRLTIRVADDGVGVPATARAGVGMTSMRERAAELGGTVQISPQAKGGTSVTATLPMLVGPASGQADPARERVMVSAPVHP